MTLAFMVSSEHFQTVDLLTILVLGWSATLGRRVKFLSPVSEFPSKDLKEPMLIAHDMEIENSMSVVGKIPYILFTVEDKGIAFVAFPIVILGYVESHRLTIHSNLLL